MGLLSNLRTARRPLLAAALSSGLLACGGDPAFDDEALELGLAFQISPSAAVPPEQIHAFEVGAVRGLPNDDCLPFSTRPVEDASLTCPDRASGSQLLELRDGEGRAVKKLTFAPALSGTGRQLLELRVPVGPDTSILIQAKDASGGLLGSGCAFVGRVSISSVEFNNRTAELNLDESYASCLPVLP